MEEKDINLRPNEVLDTLTLISKSRKFLRPRGKQSPRFSIEEIRALTLYLFLKPPYVEIRNHERLPRRREQSVKKRLFIQHFFGDAKYNGAKAARMAGYSPRSAKQIAYRIKHT